MAEEITKLDSPIDVMYLMHKAFRAQSARTEQLAAGLEEGGDLQAFKEAFEFWGKQLLYHAAAEDHYMTAPLTDSQAARDNEAEHEELREHATEVIGFLEKGDAAGLAENVYAAMVPLEEEQGGGLVERFQGVEDLQAAMLALEEEQHEELVERFQEVEEQLKRALGENKVVARTRRHLYRRVMALRILEYDHFENEEVFVVPLVRERMSEQLQLEVACRLLIDQDAEDPGWVLDWVASELSPGERKLLASLEARFSTVAA